MASGYDGSIRIRALLDHGKFDAGLASMNNSLRRFSGTLSRLAATVGIAFGVAAIVNFGKESVKAASATSDAWIGLQSIVEGQGRSFSRAKSFIQDYVSDGLVPLQNAVTSYKNLAARGYSTEQIEKLMRALKDSASFGRQASYTLGEAIQTATEGLKNENSILVDNAGVTKNVSVMWREYAQSIGVGERSLTLAQRRQAEVNGILEETKFQAGDAAKLVNTYSGQVAMLGFNFQQLKVEVGNALIPIARAVLPGINAIISALTKLAKVFAQVTALLFGKSSEVKVSGGVEESALSASDATDKLADSTGNLGDASKKAGKDMKGVQAGFDELNILASKAAGSLDDAAGSVSDVGGGLSDLDGGGEIWGDAEINPKITEDIYKLKRKLEEMIPLISGIASGLLAWKIASSLLPDLNAFAALLGSLMVAVGVTLLVDSIQDILFGEGLTWKNILEGGAGGALAGGGLGLMLAKKLGLTWAKGMLGGAIIGLGVALLLESVADIITKGLNIGNGILGVIGGAIAGAAAGFLYMGGPGGAILGASIGVGVSLVVESIADIIVSGLNLANGAIGLIGGALAGAGLGFYLGGPVGAAIGAVVGVGLTLSLEGVVSQIADGVNVIGALTTIVGSALAGAGIGFAIGGPVGAGVGAVVGLLAGIVLEVTGITATGKAIYETTEDFQTMKRVIDECQDSSDRSSAAMENLSRNIEGLKTSLADAGAAQALVDEIYAINDNASASKYELEQMATKVEILNGMGLGDLHLTIDETTGRIVETKEATDKLIEAIRQEAETAALQSLLVDAYKSRYQAVVDAEDAVKKVDVAEQALRETEQKLTETPWWDLQNHAALTEQQKKQTEALEAATDARDKAITAYDELGGAINTYSDALTNLSEPESNVGVTLETRMNSVRGTVEGVAADMPGYGKDIGEGLEQGMSDGVEEKRTKSIFERIGDWFKNLFGIHSPSKVFEDFGIFMMDGLYNGLDGNMSPVTELLSSLWSSIETTANEKWEGIKNSLGETWDNIKTSASEKFDEVKSKIVNSWEDTKSETSKKWGETETSLSTTWGNVKSNAETSFSNIKNAIVGAWNELDTSTGNIWDDIWGSIKGVINSILGGVETMVNGVINGLNKMIKALNNLKFDVPDWVPAIGGSKFGFNIPTLGTVSLPRLANGAVIPPNQQFAAILGDQRSGTNIEAPLSTIEQALQNVINRNGGMGGATDVSITFNGSLSELARILQPAIQVEAKRRGMRLTEVTR